MMVIAPYAAETAEIEIIHRLLMIITPNTLKSNKLHIRHRRVFDAHYHILKSQYTATYGLIDIVDPGNRRRSIGTCCHPQISKHKGD